MVAPDIITMSLVQRLRWVLRQPGEPISKMLQVCIWVGVLFMTALMLWSVVLEAQDNGWVEARQYLLTISPILTLMVLVPVIFAWRDRVVTGLQIVLRATAGAPPTVAEVVGRPVVLVSLGLASLILTTSHEPWSQPVRLIEIGSIVGLIGGMVMVFLGRLARH